MHIRATAIRDTVGHGEGVVVVVFAEEELDESQFKTYVGDEGGYDGRITTYAKKNWTKNRKSRPRTDWTRRRRKFGR